VAGSVQTGFYEARTEQAARENVWSVHLNTSSLEMRFLGDSQVEGLNRHAQFRWAREDKANTTITGF
jgi:hypothetical protein